MDRKNSARMRRRAAFVLALLVVPWLLGSRSSSDAERLARQLGMSDAAIARVVEGEIAVEELEASNEKDLSLALVALVEGSIDRIWDLDQQDKFADVSQVMLDEGAIETTTFALEGFRLSDEVLDQLVADPTLFALSEAEAAEMEAAARQGRSALSETYEKLLSDRARAYWNGGLAAIEPYAGKRRSPRDDLEVSNEVARSIVGSQELRDMMEGVPAKDSVATSQRLEWAVQKGRDQAAPVLVHNMAFRSDDANVYVERHFYSGYDYDSLQILVGVLPGDEGRSAVFYLNRTYTSQVAGFGGGAKRAIGRKLMQSALVEEMERIQEIAAAN